MAIKTFYNTPTNEDNEIYGPSLDTLYESGGGFGFYSKDGDTTVIPLGSTINSVTFRLWMDNPDGALENRVRFCYLADYDKCSKSSSTDQYYYVGSSEQHHGNGNEYLKYFTFVSSTSGKNHATNPSLKHNYEVTIYPETNQEKGLNAKNIAFLTSKYLNVTSVRKNQIRCYSGKSYRCYGIEMDINYTPSTVTPGNPTFSYPTANKTTYNTKPWFKFTSGKDATTFYYRVDSNSWQNFSCKANTTYEKQWPSSLSTGSHTVYIYNTSETNTVNPANKTGTSIAFTISEPEAAVSTGSTINSITIEGLQSNIRNQQHYYGQTQTTFTACNAGDLILSDYINQMKTVIEALPHPTSLSSVNTGTLITAATINSIRTALLNA